MDGLSLTFKPKNTHYHEKYEIAYLCRTKSGEPIRIRDKGLISVQRMISAHQNIKNNLQNIIDERTAEALPIFTPDTGLHSGISNYEGE